MATWHSNTRQEKHALFYHYFITTDFHICGRQIIRNETLHCSWIEHYILLLLLLAWKEKSAEALSGIDPSWRGQTNVGWIEIPGSKRWPLCRRFVSTRIPSKCFRSNRMQNSAPSSVRRWPHIKRRSIIAVLRNKLWIPCLLLNGIVGIKPTVTTPRKIIALFYSIGLRTFVFFFVLKPVLTPVLYFLDISIPQVAYKLTRISSSSSSALAWFAQDKCSLVWCEQMLSGNRRLHLVPDFILCRFFSLLYTSLKRFSRLVPFLPVFFSYKCDDIRNGLHMRIVVRRRRRE